MEIEKVCPFHQSLIACRIGRCALWTLSPWGEGCAFLIIAESLAETRRK